jgi:hypothetical protein
MDDPKWITVKSAFKLAQKALYSEFAALEALDNFLSTHVVHARASAVAVDYDSGPVPIKYGPEPLTLTRHEVSKKSKIQLISGLQRPPRNSLYELNGDFLKPSGLSRHEPRLWRWSDGIMIRMKPSSLGACTFDDQNTPFSEIPLREAAYDVEIESQHLEEFLRKKSAKLRSALNSGRKMSNLWPVWVAELVSVYHENGIEERSVLSMINLI